MTTQPSEAVIAQLVSGARAKPLRRCCAGLSPMQVLLTAPRQRPLVVLHSGRWHPRWSRWSLVAQPTGVLRHHCGRTSWESLGDGCEPESRYSDDPLRDLGWIERRIAEHGIVAPWRGSEGPWRAGWIGYLSYDLGLAIEPRAGLRSRQAKQSRSSWPLYEWLWCPQVFVHDALDGRWHCADAHRAVPMTDEALREALLLTDESGVRARGERVVDPWRCPQSQVALENAVGAAAEYIRAGDIFQANIARQFLSRSRVDSRELAAAAWRAAPGRYGAYLECSAERRLLSLSPELFLEVDRRNRSIVTRPLKGTAPASHSRSRSRAALARSDKDAAELNMIVDLMRNDLGRVCEYGSVKVTQSRAIESHPTVHHGVATIEGRLRESVGFVEMLRAAFPAGSITGAPKIRAMQIIDELEPFARGPYCGSIGYVGPERICLNVAIRTMMIDGDQVTYSAGAGIVADSTPQHEVEEMDAKAAVVQALASTGLMENEPVQAIHEAEVHA